MFTLLLSSINFHHEPLKPYIFGGKGVHSQEDGTAQLIVKSQESQREVIEIIKRDFPQMQALQLTISWLPTPMIDLAEDKKQYGDVC